jgi:hypothetical protein
VDLLVEALGESERGDSVELVVEDSVVTATGGRELRL